MILKKRLSRLVQKKILKFNHDAYPGRYVDRTFSPIFLPIFPLPFNIHKLLLTTMHTCYYNAYMLLQCIHATTMHTCYYYCYYA